MCHGAPWCESFILWRLCALPSSLSFSNKTVISFHQDLESHPQALLPKHPGQALPVLPFSISGGNNEEFC